MTDVFEMEVTGEAEALVTELEMLRVRWKNAPFKSRQEVLSAHERFQVWPASDAGFILPRIRPHGDDIELDNFDSLEELVALDNNTPGLQKRRWDACFETRSEAEAAREKHAGRVADAQERRDAAIKAEREWEQEWEEDAAREEGFDDIDFYSCEEVEELQRACIGKLHTLLTAESLEYRFRFLTPPHMERTDDGRLRCFRPAWFGSAIAA